MGKIPKGGEGLKKTDENSQFQFGNLKNLGGGLNFSKMSEFQLFCNYFAIILQFYLFKKCLKQDLGLKCSAWKVFGSNDFGLVGLYNKTKLNLFGSKKIWV